MCNSIYARIKCVEYVYKYSEGVEGNDDNYYSTAIASEGLYMS